jgi:GNAT superfamily N-acetyltransferase
MLTDAQPGPVRVRPVELHDFAQWRHLWQSYNAHFSRLQANEPTITELTWGWLHDPTEPVYGLVAERQPVTGGAPLVGAGTLVGIAHYILHRNTGTIGRVCYLQDLFTAPSARRAGVGRQLIDAVYRAATAAAAERVYWQTPVANFPANQLYDAVASRLDVVVFKRELT